MFTGAEKATGLSVRPLLDQADSALLYSQLVSTDPLKVQLLMSGYECSITCFGGSTYPGSQKTWHEVVRERLNQCS